MLQTAFQCLRELIVEAGVIRNSIGALAVENNTAGSPKEVFAAVGVLETS